MDKRALQQAILAQLERYHLDALATNQSIRAQKLHDSKQAYQLMDVYSYTNASAIGLSALIELKTGDAENEILSYYFLGEQADGASVTFDGKTILLTTPASPMGRSLLGKRVNDEVTIYSERGPKTYTVTAIL